MQLRLILTELTEINTVESLVHLHAFADTRNCLRSSEKIIYTFTNA